MPLTYSLVTFGCRVNQADSLTVEEQLRARGASASTPENADLVVVNTCSVTASADQGARQTIRRIARVNPNARIVVTGCFATRERDQVESLAPGVTVVRNDEKLQFVSLLRSRSALTDGAAGEAEVGSLDTAQRFGDGDGSCGAAIEPGVAGRTAFTLRVQTGCSQPCSYCIIPETRGAPRSAPIPEVLANLRRVVAAGYREVALTGVHLGSYGRDLEPRTSLERLLIAVRDEVAAFETRVLVRISSLEPMDCSDRVVALVAESACFAPHFHLPLQHASGRMLSAMRRPYTVEQYDALVRNIRVNLPQASIGTDVIVGFPGESDDDFEQLAEYLEGSPLTHVHVFPYSDRPGTAASRLGNRAPGIVVKNRAARLRTIGTMLTRRFVDAQRGAEHDALTLEDGTLVVTGNYLKVRVPPGQPRNAWVRVRITETAPGLQGVLLQSSLRVCS
ncbi:MAG: MiaB/RimO family radical SAM methylthiotransferase [Vicinamibacterales bacterium]